MRKIALFVLALSLFCSNATAGTKFNPAVLARVLVSEDAGFVSISSDGQLRGKLVNPDDPRVIELARIVTTLTRKYAWETTANGRKLPRYDYKADMIVALATGIQQELRHFGISESSFNILKGMSQLPTKNGNSFISEYLTVYAQQRFRGLSHEETIAQLKALLLKIGN